MHQICPHTRIDFGIIFAMFFVAKTKIMRRFLPFVYLLFLSFLFVSCWKKLSEPPHNDGLPHGENTWYYYVDGRLVIPKTKWAGESWLYAVSYAHCPQGSVNAGGLELRDSEHFYMLIANLSPGRHDFQQEDYPLCDNPNGSSAFLIVEEADSTGNLRHNAYYTTPGSGYIQIDYVSPDKRRLRGRFEMTLYCDVTGRTKHVTDGHFDLNLDKLHGQ